jgi:hypothetical protein
MKRKRLVTPTPHRFIWGHGLLSLLVHASSVRQECERTGWWLPVEQVTSESFRENALVSSHTLAQLKQEPFFKGSTKN